VAAVYPDMGFVPTGGIDADGAAGYLALDCVVAVGGSWLVRPELLRAGRFDEVERLAREVAPRSRA
jgi:2-dehydro-3-deoxyphosphogluconate aldolase/(4S)-4-hydroxy-2-oxoglutarate aldolase